MHSVYIHLPFCTNICSYCDFSKIYYNKKYIFKYLDALKEEIQQNYHGEVIKTIYIGGGTPSSLEKEELVFLMKIIKVFKLSSDYEFTFECNVENTSEEKLNILYKNGVNRLSFGVQSFNNNLLKFLNRKHTKEQAINIINLAKKTGFININMDLIYGIPTQTKEDLINDLQEFIKLDIPHISAYSLIIEKNTVLAINNQTNIDEDLEYEMYQLIQKTLSNNKYIQYEISNYSIPGYESKHNLNYWNNSYYYGFGMGSVGFLLNNTYTYNTKNIQEYIKGNTLKKVEIIDKKTKMSNEMILGLRKRTGVSILEFKKKYHQDLLSTYKIDDLLETKKLITTNNHLKINSKYIYLSNDILINFID